MSRFIKALFLLVWCVLQGQGAYADPADDGLQFSILEDEEGREILMLWGGIGPGDASRFLGFAKAHPGIRGFWIASPGGNPDSAMEVGRLLRKTGLPVRVPSKAVVSASIDRAFAKGGKVARSLSPLDSWLQQESKIICVSACDYLLMGGRIRIVDLEHTVGLHAARKDGMADLIKDIEDPALRDQAYKDLERDTQNGVARKNEYIAEMSISQRFSQISSAVPSQCMYYLSAAEMTALNLTNVNSMQTKGGNRGVCDCWAFARGDPRIPTFNRACEKSAASGVAEWTVK